MGWLGKLGLVGGTVVAGVACYLGAGSITYWALVHAPRGLSQGATPGAPGTSGAGEASGAGSGEARELPRGDDAAALAEVVRVGGLGRRVDPVDGKTVVFELLPGYRTVAETEDDARGTKTVRLELRARVRADATLPESTETLTLEVLLDTRARRVVSVRRLATASGEDEELEKLTRRTRP